MGDLPRADIGDGARRAAPPRTPAQQRQPASAGPTPRGRATPASGATPGAGTPMSGLSRPRDMPSGGTGFSPHHAELSGSQQQYPDLPGGGGDEQGQAS